MKDQPSAPDRELRDAWRTVCAGLATYLADMAEDDHLIVEMPSIDDDSELTTPYAQFAVTRNDEIRAELSGNSVLHPTYRLTSRQLAGLRRSGWQLPDDHDGPNLHRYAAKDDLDRLTTRIGKALAGKYAVPHPSLLSVRAWGPNADNAGCIGLPLEHDGRNDAEIEAAELLGIPPPAFDTPRDQLLARVELALSAHYGHAVVRDADDDFPLPGRDVPAWVRVLHGMPVIEVFTLVVDGVRSRRQAAVEASLLNRDQPLVKFMVCERAVVAAMQLPVPSLEADVLIDLLPTYLATVDDVRHDLALRTGAH